jgi:hypothetical protein
MQAWRAGFREGVKMLTKNGVLVKKENITSEIWWHNIHRLRMWSCVGSHTDNGNFAILGARQGSAMAYSSDWNYYDVRDFECLIEIYNDRAKLFENNNDACIEEINKLGKELKMTLGLNWAYFDPPQSKYVVDMYNESIALGQTYFNQGSIWKNSF